MATISEIISEGPGAIGPGTDYTWARLDPNRSTGTVTAIVDTGVTSASELPALAQSIFPTTYPGDLTATPLRYVRVKLIGAQQALCVGYYGRGGNSGQFVQRLRVSPAQRQAKTYKYNDDATDDEIVGDDGFYLPHYITIQQAIVQWADVIYSDTGPNLQFSLAGKINSNSYSIEGYSFPAKSLMFMGLDLVYEKYGAFDRWYQRYTVLYDSALWQEGYLDKSGGAPGTPVARDMFPTANYIAFPSLP